LTAADRAVRRYASGLVLAFAVIGVACAAIIVPTVFVRGAAGRLFEFVPLWFAFGIPTLLTLALVVGPPVLFAQRPIGAAFAPWHAALAGAFCGPALLIVIWFIFREHNETLSGLVGFWRRVPGEFIFGALPPTAAGAIFCEWITSPAREQIL